MIMDRNVRSTGWYSRWWSTSVKLVVLYLCLHSCSDKFCNCTIPEETKEEFENRSPEQWRENWLVGTIWTCQGAELQRMGELACINDPRRDNNVVKRSISERELFLPAKLAKAFLHYRHRKDSRRRRTGKDEECCGETQGCKWEELGEYCNRHRRLYHESGSQP